MNTDKERALIYRRKNEHLSTVLKDGVEPASRGAGFEAYAIPHCALPEAALGDVDAAASFLGKRISFPLMISATSGGTPETHGILLELARAACEAKVALGVGSQRIAIEYPDLAQYFEVRSVAGDVPVLANLGAVQLNYGFTAEHCRRAVDMIGADALVLHLNPLQECLQTNGNTDFGALLEKIALVCRELPVPVIVKEVGFGILPAVARRLKDAGVAWIDIAGTGGTSWTAVESVVSTLSDVSRIARSFAGWGTPTAHLLWEYAKDPSSPRPLIASGGIRTGVDIAKAIAMGASMAGIALPLIRAASRSPAAVRELIERLRTELAVAMLCSGATTIKQLGEVPVVRTGPERLFEAHCR